ncbi:MAG: helicase-related protein, partial [Thermodesulfobacteriota bacterium]|nr:helicase-related protein [Thermodesulfobacteriota bacterium]
ALNPALRILGVTATPSRLGHGYIYGDKCAPGSQNLFPRLNHSVEYEGLKNQGWLVPLKGKVATHKSLTQDLENVSVSGDYVLQELGDTLSQQRHIQTAVDAIRLYTQDYKKICVFCCTIDHAKQLAKMLGDETTIVHSQLSPIERQINMQAWITGRSRIITSVNILTEGFDMPDLDCLIMVRPTLSSSLFLQSVGRVLRTSPGKDHGFLLDLTNNTAYFGTNLDNIKVTVPKSVQDMIKKDNELIKLCPMCEKEVHIALRKCPCGYEWPASTFEEAEKIPEMEDVDFERVEPEWHDIDKQVVDDHVGRKSRKRLGKMTLIYGQNIYHPKEVSLWFCLPDEYNGYAVEKARQLWKKVGKSKFPESVDEFLDSEFEIITEILLDENGDYPEIKEIKTVPF